MTNDITNRSVWNTRQLIAIILVVISTTFTLTMIYSRFLSMENEIQTNEERSTKRYNRVVSDQETIWNEINKLKEK